MKKEYNFSFVILNYITTEDTINCVNSIREKCNGYNYHIVIVDNASPNNSGNKLVKLYNDNPLVEVILSKTNLGFARGNNLGFMFAKNNLNSDFIILCNSDTQLLHDDFCDKIIKKYQESNYAVLGPKEKLLDGKYFPLQEKVRSKLKLKIDILYNKYLLNSNGIRLYFTKVLNLMYSLLFWQRKLDVDKEYENIVLHGAFLVFSKKYIELFDGLNPITFFYGEEEMLAIRLYENKLKSIYFPSVEILHKQKSSTNALENGKNKFVLECHLDSAKKILAVLEGKNKY